MMKSLFIFFVGFLLGGAVAESMWKDRLYWELRRQPHMKPCTCAARKNNTPGFVNREDEQLNLKLGRYL